MPVLLPLPVLLLGVEVAGQELATESTRVTTNCAPCPFWLLIALDWPLWLAMLLSGCVGCVPVSAATAPD